MSRLQKRLQIYGLICTLLTLTLWLFVPHTRSQSLGSRRKPLPRRSVPVIEEVKTSQDELEWLRTLFKKTDTTTDGLVSLNELTHAIHKTVGQHIQKAMMMNPRTFFR